MGSPLRKIAPDVEIALALLAESLNMHQDDIPNGDYILTQLALACYKLGERSNKISTPKVPTKRRFPAPNWEDEVTPVKAVIVVNDDDA